MSAFPPLPPNPTSGGASKPQLLDFVQSLARVSIDSPNSPNVIKALSNPNIYQQLVERFNQSPLKTIDVFKTQSSNTCGTGTVCPAYEGKTETINGREYNLYCINAPWDASPYIWDNGYQKIGAIPVSNQPTAFPPGALCPLPASDNQVWSYGDNREYTFKLSCLNAFQVPASAKKNIGFVKEVDECAIPCGKDDKCRGFHYYQESLSGGRADGARKCEFITEAVEENQWTPLYKPNQYMAGLKISGDYHCGEPAWDQDNGCRVEEGLQKNKSG
ncbi:MAG: hypothetical protein Q9218_006686 [Villophora microphyllina]